MIRILLLAAVLPFSAFAGEPVIVKSGATQTAVVELYTSEGCSSCPPADRWLSHLLDVPSSELDVVALAFHVDYWNYLGWTDRFSSPAYTSRQRQLGANNLQRTIYTPEFFVNGKETRGSDRIIDEIRQANRRPAALELELEVSREQTGLLLELRAGGATDRPAHHRFLVYENGLSTDVERGENRGEFLRHQAVVRYMSEARILRPENRYRIDIDPAWNPGNVGVAVVVTTPGSRQYLQAVHAPVGGLLTRD